ncbi:MAG: hypothetical protein U9P00_13435 [Pseudomonadota bacterium]|nr:hypothetical protein [Pseudomonadota bacterium]
MIGSPPISDGVSPPRPIDDEELLFHKQAAGDNGLSVAGSEQFGDRGQ